MIPDYQSFSNELTLSEILLGPTVPPEVLKARAVKTAQKDLWRAKCEFLSTKEAEEESGFINEANLEAAYSWVECAREALLAIDPTAKEWNMRGVK